MSLCHSDWHYLCFSGEGMEAELSRLSRVVQGVLKLLINLRQVLAALGWESQGLGERTSRNGLHLSRLLVASFLGHGLWQGLWTLLYSRPACVSRLLGLVPPCFKQELPSQETSPRALAVSQHLLAPTSHGPPSALCHDRIIWGIFGLTL